MSTTKVAPEGDSIEVEGANYTPKSERAEDHAHRAANVPDWCPPGPYAETESPAVDDEKLWEPRTEDEDPMPRFLSFAQAALTFAQVNQDVVMNDALENSCTGRAEEYILNTLHDSGYSGRAALQRILMKDVPANIVDRWTVMDTNLFERGLSERKKKFWAIQRALLPHKTTADIVGHYYEWKRAGRPKGQKQSAARVFLRRQWGTSSRIIGSMSDVGVTTRRRSPGSGDTPEGARSILVRKDVYTGVKRKRKSTKK